MRLGDYKFRRRYTLIQILVDIASLGVLLFIFYIPYVCAVDVEQMKINNATETSLDFLDWKPLIIWCVLGLLIYAASVLLIVLPRKMPKNLTVTEKYAPKYCNIVDACISCLRFVLLLSVFELSYLHMKSILVQKFEFSIQLILYVVIGALLIWFTAVRLSSLSDVAENELKEEKNRQIIEN